MQYTAIVFITELAAIILMVSVHGNSFLPIARRHSFLLLLAILMVTNAAEWLAACLDGAPAGLRTLHIFAKFMELTLTTAIPMVGVLAIGEHQRVKWLAIPAGVNFILQLLSLHFGFVFAVDAQNVYHRGPLYAVYVLAFVCGILLAFSGFFRFSRRYQFHNGTVLSLILVLIAFGIVSQLVDHSLRLDWVCVSLSAMLFYIYYSDLLQQTDSLTALLNRRSFESGMENLRRPAVILFFDVDHFKEVNDCYGHQYGDTCLAAIASAIRTAYGRYGRCYRFGGDEFCVMLERETQRLDKLNANFTRRMDVLHVCDPHMPQVSMGYAEFDPARDSLEDALKRADMQMYGSKHAHHESEKPVQAAGVQ